jgi:iron complex outermembrane receptor protein
MTRVRLLTSTCSLLAIAAAGLFSAMPAAAQPVAAGAQPASQLGEIIVTARKRQESIMNVPVIETAIGQQQMQRFQTQDLKDIATLVPGLAVGDNLLSIGTTISIRGVGTTTYDPGVDQSVSLNIDGMQFSQGLAYASGFFDLGQAEILKGPQALFYGKSSPGGVISLRTADPTDQVEVIGRAGYEFEAKQRTGDLIVSGPITDTLKGRIAGTYSAQDGFYYNKATGLAALGSRDPTKSRVGSSKSYQIRGTLLWNPTSQFNARLKVNQVHDRTLYAGTEQYVQCPEGTAPLPGLGIPFLLGEDCKRDRTERLVPLDPASFPGIENNGVPFLENTQTYGTLELNYRLRPDLTLTSVTGYYLLHSNSLVNTTQTTFAAPLASVTNHFKRHDESEELRLNSDFAGPVNFTLGGLVQRGGFGDLVFLGGNTALQFPAFLLKGTNEVKTKTNSVFGQVRWQIIPKLEIAAGARWTDETRSDRPTNYSPTGTAIPISIPVPKINSKNTSPELTLTYKPADNWTVFGSLKRGYKSGSFDVATPATAGEDNSFGDEKVEGYEVGVKSRLLDRRLSTNLAFYDYRYTGLQVGGIDSAPGIPVIRTLNAGSALVYGVDFDATYRPEMIDGLALQGAVEWNDAHFKTLNNLQCFGGQTQAMGCVLINDPITGNIRHVQGAELGTAQDVSGSPLVRAPKWQVNFGFDYERDVGNGMSIILSNNNHLSSRYNTNLNLAYYQKSFLKSDVSLTLRGPRDRWEFALIGKNIGNQLTAGTCNNFNGQAGGPFLGVQTTGGTNSGLSGIDEVGCFMDRGREFWLRLTVKPFA